MSCREGNERRIYQKSGSVRGAYRNKTCEGRGENEKEGTIGNRKIKDGDEKGMEEIDSAFVEVGNHDD